MKRTLFATWWYLVLGLGQWFDFDRLFCHAFVPGSGVSFLSPRLRTRIDRASVRPIQQARNDDYDQEEQKEEALQSLQDYHRGTWKGRATSFSVVADVAAGIVQKHTSPEYQTSVRLDGTDNTLSMLETMQWDDKVVSRKTPFVQCSMDVDSVDASYSLDSTLLDLPSDIVGTDKLITFGIEHCLATSDDERVRCFVLYGVDQSLARIVLCEETRIKSTTPAANGKKVAPGNIDAILDKVVGTAPQQPNFLSAPSEEGLALSRHTMNLMDMTSGVWLGDTIVRDLPHVSLTANTVGRGFGSSTAASSVSNSPKPKSFADWNLGVQKIACRWDWDYGDSITVLNDFGRGMGAETSPTMPRALSGSICVNESYSRRIPKDQRMVYVDYDNGDHVGFLFGSACVQVPRFVTFSSTPKQTKPFFTEFSVFQSNAAPTEGIEREVCCSKMMRLYNFEGQLKQGCTSFLTLKDMVESQP